MKRQLNVRETAPTVFVAKGRQRVKQYDNHIVYLKNGNEFELELFNPTTRKVLAKIKIDGKSLGSGIILRPGERVFLERYFDEAKKFLFETYNVDKNNINVKEAIKLNGVIDVEFYDEYVPSGNIICGVCSGTTVTNKNFYTTYGTDTYNLPGNQSFTTNTSDCSNINFAFDSISNTANISSNIKDVKTIKSAKLEETGKVEKGSYSDQSFMYDSTAFNSYVSWFMQWTILPLSQKPHMAEDLSIFCTGCGAKRKKLNHKFCPICGNKF